MAAIYKRGRIWYVDYRAGGKRFRRRVGPSKKVAELTLKNIEVRVSQNDLAVVPNDKPVETFLDEFTQYSRTNNTPGTCTRYKAVVDHFKRFLHECAPAVRRLCQLGPHLFEQYKTWRKDSTVTPNGRKVKQGKPGGRHPKANTVNMEVGTLRTIFGRAVQWGHLAKNPTDGVDLLRVTDAKPPRFLSKAECRKLLAHCGPDLHPIFFTFLHTG